MNTAYLGLGSNLDDRRAHLQAAVAGLQAAPATRVTAVSPVYETEAHTLDPNEEQPPFLNAVVEAELRGEAKRLLQIAHGLEREEGRARDRDRWAPRPLDVDLLVVGSVTCRTETLTLPHPRLADRRFVLKPWADLAPNLWVPPPFEATVQALLDACSDTAALRRTEHTLTISFSPDASSGESG